MIVQSTYFSFENLIVYVLPHGLMHSQPVRASLRYTGSFPAIDARMCCGLNAEISLQAGWKPRRACSVSDD